MESWKRLNSSLVQYTEKGSRILVVAVLSMALTVLSQFLVLGYSSAAVLPMSSMALSQMAAGMLST